MSAPVVVPNAKADPIYMQSVNSLARTLADFKAQQQLQASQYDTNYNDVVKNMGWNPTANAFDRSQGGLTGVNDYRDAMYANEGDFAGRDAGYSGAFANSIGQIGQEFGNRKSLVDTAKQQAADTRQQALQSFQTQQTSVQDLALADALARIASKYGIDPAQVPQ